MDAFFSGMGTIIGILGSLGLFLYGMKLMSEGVQKAAGERLHTVLNHMTSNRFVGVITGFLITALVQSSSATTVMVVSFVNAGLVNLAQSVGVILGANIGTTVTTWIVNFLGWGKFSISAYAIPAIGFGMAFMMLKKLNKKDWGETLIGFGLLFLGLSFLKKSVPGLDDSALEFIRAFEGLGFGSYALFILVGALLTVVVQSSSAAMMITLTVLSQGWITFESAAFIVLGENIGTTVTAYLASIGANVNARRAARVHTLFNLFGVVWMAFVYGFFLDFVTSVFPVAADNGRWALALFHTMFNVTNTLIMVWFAPQLAQLVTRFVKERKGEAEGPYRMPYLESTIQDTPEINVMTAKAEIAKMAEIPVAMFDRFLGFYEQSKEEVQEALAELKASEELADQMEEEISRFLAHCSQDGVNDETALHIGSMVRIVNELESITDTCYNLSLIAAKIKKKNISMEQFAMDELRPYTNLVTDFFKFIHPGLENGMSGKEMATALELEDEIDSKRNKLKKAARKRIQAGSDVKAELLYIDIVRHIERIGDYLLNISEEIRALS